MTKVAIIRCEKNEDRCPLTSCLKSLRQTAEGFSLYDQAEPAGVFTCHCPGHDVARLAKIMQAKGAEAIHLCTCSFAGKTETGWTMGEGFCDHADELLETMHEATGLPCVKGTAHLPAGYDIQRWA